MGKELGKDVFIHINNGTETTPEWVKFALSTSDGFTGNTDSLSGSTKSDGGWVDNIPTDKSWEFTNSSHVDTEADSYDLAYDAWESSAIKQFKIANDDESYYRMGKGFISNFAEGAENGDFMTVELTITGTGPVTKTPQV